MGERATGRKLLAAGALAVVGYQALQRLREADLSGQVVLLAGASRGLGVLLAHEFAAQGCRLALCARDPQSLDATRRDRAHAPAASDG